MNRASALEAKAAVNFTGMSNIKTFVPKVDGEYLVTSISEKESPGRKTLSQQVLLFNTATLEGGDYERWYFSVSNLKRIKISAQEGKPIYVFLVSPTNLSDGITITFSKL
jgi:hypothetical protein